MTSKTQVALAVKTILIALIGTCGIALAQGTTESPIELSLTQPIGAVVVPNASSGGCSCEEAANGKTSEEQACNTSKDCAEAKAQDNPEDNPDTGASEDTPNGSTEDAGIPDDNIDGEPAAKEEIDELPYENAGNGNTAVEASTDEEINGNFVPLIINEKVEAFKRYFQTRGREKFALWMERSYAYMPMVKKILAEEGLPEDIAYLALIESGYNPKAKSRAGALGVWQFMPRTAKLYGLRVDWWIDERRDTEKATRAAAKYLTNLYGMFDSWYLAAAGYNAGEGRIMRAMKKMKTDDFWDIASSRRALKRETREYVPKYLAAIMIATDPECYGFDLAKDAEPITYEKVPVPQATDIKVIAEAAGTTVTEIQRLNPELNKWFTPPDYPGYHIKLPIGTKEAFLENIKKVASTDRLKFHMHKVKKGETVSTIARRYGTGVQPIMYINRIHNVRAIKVGSLIAVPVRARDGKAVEELGKGEIPPPPVASKLLKRYTERKKSAPKTYVVRRGDTLYGISDRYGISMDEIMRLNNMRDPNFLKPGVKIHLKEAKL